MLMLFSLANHFINSLSSFRFDCMTIFVVVKYSFIIFISIFNGFEPDWWKGQSIAFPTLNPGVEEFGSNVQRLS